MNKGHWNKLLNPNKVLEDIPRGKIIKEKGKVEVEAKIGDQRVKHILTIKQLQEILDKAKPVG